MTLNDVMPGTNGHTIGDATGHTHTHTILYYIYLRGCKDTRPSCLDNKSKPSPDFYFPDKTLPPTHTHTKYQKQKREKRK